jgi:hypothetical protein
LLYLSITPLKLRLSIIFSVKSINAVYNQISLVTDLYFHFNKCYQLRQLYLKQHIKVRIKYITCIIQQDIATENAMKMLFSPSLTAQTALNCLNSKTEEILKANEKEEIQTLIKAAEYLSGSKNVPLSKKLSYFYKIIRTSIL